MGALAVGPLLQGGPGRDDQGQRPDPHAGLLIGLAHGAAQHALADVLTVLGELEDLEPLVPDGEYLVRLEVHGHGADRDGIAKGRMEGHAPVDGLHVQGPVGAQAPGGDGVEHVRGGSDAADSHVVHVRRGRRLGRDEVFVIGDCDGRHFLKARRPPSPFPRGFVLVLADVVPIAVTRSRNTH